MTTNQRWLWLDWVRIMAVHMVILYHTIEAVLNYRTKGNLHYELNAIRTCMQCIGLPLFFLISGMVKGLKSGQYRIKLSRIMYLIIPLLISTILFLIPVSCLRANILHSKNGISFKLNQQCSAHPFFEFLLFYFWKNCFIHVGFGWLWFLAMLCLLEVLSFPFIKLMDAFIINTNKTMPQSIMMLIALTICSFVYYGILRQVTQIWFILLIITTHCLLFIGIAIYYHHSVAICIKFICLTALIFGIIPIGMMCSILMLNVDDADDASHAFEHAIDYDLTYIYYWLFHLFGTVFTKVVYPDFSKHSSSTKWHKMSDYLNWFKITGYQIAILFIFSAVSIRTEKYERAYTFVNIFEETDPYQRAMFVCACWIFMYFICMTAKHSIDQQFYERCSRQRAMKIYKSSMIVYCCHGFFIEATAFWWFNGIKHYEQSVNRLDICIIFISSLALSYSLAFSVLRIERIAAFFGVRDTH